LFKVEKFIRKEIGKRFPDHQVIGEEFGKKKTKSDFTWVIDPIDGTRSYVIGNPTWSNLISLNYKGNPVIGLANYPVLNKYYFNASDKVAYVVDQRKKRKIKVNKKILFKNIKIYIFKLKKYKDYQIRDFQILGGTQTLLFLAFFASFAVKMPMWPVHTWLPDAHVQAPTAGSVVLAAILLKMGGYGFLRFSLPMFPVGSYIMTDFILWLSVIAIVYTSLVALVQSDMKKLIAYSSVAHMGYVTIGIFAANQQGIDGAIFQMLSHGFISGALFLCVGVIYDRMHTREIEAYGGLVNRMPAYALIFMFFTMANVGLPGTSGFVGEFLTLVGIFKVNTWIALLATSGVVLSAAYALWLYRRVMMGDLIKEALRTIQDMSLRERAVFAPLVFMTLLLGVYPVLALDLISPSVQSLIDNYNSALSIAGIDGNTMIASH